MVLAVILFTQACGVLKWSEVKRANQAAEVRGTSSGNTAGGRGGSSTPAKNTGSATKPAAKSPANVGGTPTVSKPSTRSERNTQSKLLDIYADWKGTPYKWGGNSKKAIDCSAFMQRTFDEGFGKQLPRTTQEQYAVGKKIDKKALQTGDLVFFKTGTNTWHVGVYLSDNQFMHASVTYGVSVTDLTNPYWKRRYIGARRIL